MSVTKKSLISNSTSKKTTKKASPKASPVTAAKLKTAVAQVTAYNVTTAYKF